MNALTAIRSLTFNTAAKITFTKRGDTLPTVFTFWKARESQGYRGFQLHNGNYKRVQGGKLSQPQIISRMSRLCSGATDIQATTFEPDAMKLEVIYATESPIELIAA